MASIRIAVIIACFIIVLFLDGLLIKWSRKLEIRKKNKIVIEKGLNDMENPGNIKQDLGSLSISTDRSDAKLHSPMKQFFHRLIPNQHLYEYAAELIPLLILAFFMAAPYLDFRQDYHPNGTNIMWLQLRIMSGIYCPNVEPAYFGMVN